MVGGSGKISNQTKQFVINSCTARGAEEGEEGEEVGGGQTWNLLELTQKVMKDLD